MCDILWFLFWCVWAVGIGCYIIAAYRIYVPKHRPLPRLRKLPPFTVAEERAIQDRNAVILRRHEIAFN